MSKNHGWNDAAIRGYGADRDGDGRLQAFRASADAIAARYAGDDKGHDVEFTNLCIDNEDLADEIPEIRECLDRREAMQAAA